MMRLFNFVPAQSREPLPDFGVKYLQHILAEYATLPATVTIPAGIGAIIKQATADPAAIVTWGDLFLLEKGMIALQPEMVIRRRAWGIRDAYREMVGQKQYEVYMASKPPNENEPNSNIEDVRADMDRLLDILHWNYALIPIRETMRNGLLRFIGNWVFWGSIVALGLATWAMKYDQTLDATLLIVMVAGGIGGFISLQQRIQDLPSGDPLISIFELQNGAFSLYLAPISGAIFALVLYLIFLGKLVSGVIFPDNVTPFNLYSPGGAVHWAYSVKYEDFAKLVVWCFIAGFAERFVPDTLNRLVNRAREAEGPTTVTPSPQPPFGIGRQATLAATAGSTQSTAVNTAFSIALQATLRDAIDKPIPNAKVTFTAPSNGASGTFAEDTNITTDAQGVATAPTFKANSVAGTYSVTATASAATSPAAFTLTNMP